MLSTADVSTLRQLAGPNGYRAATDRDRIDRRGRRTGAAVHVLRPADTATAAAIVCHCAAHRLPLVPIGGATGLVGGHTPADGEAALLLSTERMTAIRAVDPVERCLIAEAGAVLSIVQSAAEDAGMLFPLSLASEGSCTVGGNLATNAGGVQVLRYGNARDLCLGIEAVLPDGSVLDGLSPLRKNNTGYDLRHLLIGAEGTLGLITAASLKLVPALRQRATAWCPVPGPAAACEVFARLNDQLGEWLTAFELIAGTGLDFLAEHFPALPRPARSDWAVLVELGSSGEHPLTDALGDALAPLLESGLLTDAWLANGERQRREFWATREHIPLGNAAVGSIASFDISVPLGAMVDFIEQTSDAARRTGGPEHGDLRINCFGHLGDGNLHFNLFPAAGRRAADYDAVREDLRALVFDRVAACGGSFSAEHGVGRDKLDQWRQRVDPTRQAAMRAIKAALDPHGIFNPGALLD